jgi:diguanylate cyclase (GGDEF)-like protein
MTRVRIALSLIVLILAFSGGHDARAEALLSGHTDFVDLWPHARVLVDPDRTLTLEQVLAAPERFAIPRGAYATLGMTKDVVWLRVPVTVADGGDGTWILELDYALLQRVEIYSLRSGKLARRLTLGISQPFAKRPLRGRSHAVPLEFAPGSSNEILLRIDTPAKILPMSLSRLQVFHSHALHEQFLQGTFAALGLVLLVFSLAQWLSMREALYVKYALLVLCSMTYSVHFFGIGEMYLWTDHGWAGRHMAGVTALLAAAATALFVEDAMSGDLHRWLARGLRAVAVLHVIAALAYGVDLIDLQTVAILMSTTGLAPAVMGMPGALAKARRGDSVGGWFLIAWIGYFISSAVMVGVVTGRVGANFWTLHSFQIGHMLDMLIFMRIAVLRTASKHREARRAVQERDTLHSLAHSDPLTGLLNRRGFDDALAGALARATPERMLALYVIDLDGFKPVNDQFGHDVGDELLRVVAQRLRTSVRAGDGVARVGGDEFVVMADGLTNETQARELGLKLLEAFRTPFVLGENTCRVSATIGYALAPVDAPDASTSLKAADAAMYAGKQDGKDRLVRVGS